MQNVIELTNDQIGKAAHCLKVLGNPVRLQIVALLSQQPKTVKDLASMVEVPHNVACEHLRLLLHCGFVKSAREGKKVWYQIHDEHLLDLLSCIRKRFKNME